MCIAQDIKWFESVCARVCVCVLYGLEFRLPRDEKRLTPQMKFTMNNFLYKHHYYACIISKTISRLCIGERFAQTENVAAANGINNLAKNWQQLRVRRGLGRLVSHDGCVRDANAKNAPLPAEMSV